jgi:Ca-activated chloride channel family protein
VSGSMHVFPLDISKKLLRNLISNLRSQDRFNVLLFAGGSSVLFNQSMPANAANISNAINHINNQRGGGGTELLPALRRALAMKGTEDYSRSFIIVTDGYVSVEKEAFDLINKNLGKANFFAFGIGSSVNRYIIEGIAHVGMGIPFILTNGNEASGNADTFRKYVSSPVLTNIKIKYPGLEVYDVEPQNVPDVLSERPVVIIGKYRGKASGSIELTGTTGKGKYKKSIDLSEVKPSDNNKALKYLWARKRIQLLDDYNNVGNDIELVKEITELGLKYNILTNYTSFVAVDSEIRNTGGEVTTINQPLPLPYGVSNYAVGGGKKSYAKRAGGYASAPVLTECLAAEEVDISYSDRETQHEMTVKFEKIEKMPEFTGGLDAFNKYINDNIKYPQELMAKRVTGRVFVEFTVNTDGSISNIRILRGLHPLLDKEVIRLLEQSPRWKPGIKGGKAARISVTIPVLIK